MIQNRLPDDTNFNINISLLSSSSIHNYITFNQNCLLQYKASLPDDVIHNLETGLPNDTILNVNISLLSSSSIHNHSTFNQDPKFKKIYEKSLITFLVLNQGFGSITIYESECNRIYNVKSVNSLTTFLIIGFHQN